MKIKLAVRGLLIAVVLAGVPVRSPGVSTDGSVAYSMTTQNYDGSYDPNNVAAVWVVDSDGRFVRTLCRHAVSRVNYLYQWNASCGTYKVDGYTSATLTSQPQTHAVTWDCRDTNGVVVPDGTYYIRAEYTSSNGQGPFLSNGCVFAKGSMAWSTNYPNYTDAAGQFTAMTLAYTPAADVGIIALSPSAGIVDSNVAVHVLISNLTYNAATFSVGVSNLTSGSLIGSQTVTDLAGQAATNLIFNWNSTGLAVGEYTIRAVASALVNETVLTNNILSRAIFLSSATAGDIAITAMAPSSGIVNAWVPVTVAVTNVMSDATGPFMVSLTNPPFATANFSNSWPVAASADDAEENATTHAVSINSTDLELVLDATNQDVGVRFAKVGIPPNATLSSAFIQFTGRAGQNLNVNPITLTIKGQAADNAGAFAGTISNISSRAFTTSAVTWSPANWVDGETGLNARTPDLKAVVQEIVNRPGWAISNALVFKISGVGGRRAWSYDGNSNAVPQLSVQWSSLAPQVVTQSVANLSGGAGTNVVLSWNTAGLTAGVYQISAVAGPLLTETHLSDNVLTSAIALRIALHDVAVNAIQITPMVPPGVITNVRVTLTNLGDVAETLTNTLRDLTATPTVIGTRTITGLGPGKSTNLVYAWNTATNAGFALGYHLLQSSLNVVSGETSTANNTTQIQVAVATGLRTNTLIARTASWRYLDQGLNLSAAPWATFDYDDGFWSSGPAPLGFGLPSLATIIHSGTDPTQRPVTAYFRREFTMDFTPFTVTGRVMRTHGVVLFLNGVEFARQNMPPGAIGYGTLATSGVTGVEATNYFGFTLPPSALAVGRNLLSAELHLASVTNTTAGFALELVSVTPAVPFLPSVAVTAVEPDGSVQSGDPLGFSITLTNNGNTATACQVLLRDATSGAILASQSVDILVPGESIRIGLTWPTFGAVAGARTLQVVTVINGVTNFAGSGSAPVVIDTPVFDPRLVNAAGSVGGRCSAVAVTGRYVFLGCGATLEIWDALVPASPVRVGAVRLPGIIEDLEATSNGVFAATGAAGVQIIDVSNPAQPVHCATFDTSGYARRMTLDGHRLFVADAYRGVRVIDVSHLAAPVLAGAFQTVGPAQALALESSRLLVLDGQIGLQTLHAADPAAMTVTGSLNGISAGLALTAVPGTAWLTDGKAGLYRCDLTTPATPSLMTNALLPASGRGMAISVNGSVLYVAAGAAGLLTVDAATLALQTSTAVGDEAYDIAVAGDTLYIAAGFAGCRSLNIAAPLAPQPLAFYRTGARAVDAAMSGPVLFLAADEAGLQVHNLTNQLTPDWLTTVAASTNPRCVLVSGNLAYVAEALGGLKIFNVANPASPSWVGSQVGAGLVTIRRMALAGSRLALTDGRQINLVDVSNPANPVQIATNRYSGYLFDLAANTSHFFVACGGAGLRILNPTTLATVGTFSTAPDPVVTVGVQGHHVYIGDGRATVRILSITNPAAPTLVQSVAGSAFQIAAAGPYVHWVDARNQGAVVDMSDPLNPVPRQALSHLTLGLRVRAQGGIVLTAEDEAGLGIFNVSSNDINLNGIPDTEDQWIADADPGDFVRSIWDVLPDDDFDQDGLSNLAEYWAGTGPTDAASRFAISVVNSEPGANGGQFVVRWYSVPGKTYTVHKSTNLTEGFTPLKSGIVDSAPINCYTDAVTTANAFYLISVP